MLMMDREMDNTSTDADVPPDVSKIVANERAALVELHTALQGTLSTPQRILVTTSAAGEEDLRQLINKREGFSVETEAVAPPVEDAAANRSECKYFSPKSGN